MKKGIIYLIQPQELLGTRTYKIGCLRNHDIDELKGCRIICMLECNNQYNVKYHIKTDMEILFKGDLISGDISFIKDEFLKLFKKYSVYKDTYSDYIFDDIIDDITTYEYYTKTSKISHIVITDPKLLIGYFLIKNNSIWSHFDINN